MPVSFLSEAERLHFNSFPSDLSTSDLIIWFTLSDIDLLQIPKTTTPANRLGFALRILLLRFLGFHLTDLTSVPATVVDFVAAQIKTDAEQINFYAERGATRTVHQRAIEEYLGFSLPTEQDLTKVSVWLLERALEHDRPTLLLQLLCEHFLVEKLVRPGFSVLERMVATAGNAAETELFKRVESIIAETKGLLEAVNILKELNATKKRRIPDDAPFDFVSAEWKSYVFDKEHRFARKYYELCVLFELRLKLRSGDVWVEGSRRYAKLESYLIPLDEWEKIRPQVCELLNISTNAEHRIKLRQAELQELYGQFDRFFDKTKSSETEKITVRMEKGQLIVAKLPGEDLTPSSQALKEEIINRLPEIELTDLLIEVDGWTNFSRYFVHPNGNEPRSPDTLQHCYASILAQSCNFGLMQMQRMSGLTYRKMAWYSIWYLREETLKSAFSELVDFHHGLPLSQVWGGGTLSSSDGQRFPVSVKTRNAVSVPRYFGYGRGLTYYTWTSDQYSQYGTKVIPTTVRDATYVLDEILDNETELTILEHTTDTAGYTDLVFGLFDLLKLQFSPRLADLADKKLYRLNKEIKYKNINSLITGNINADLILRHWDDLLRIAGSLKLGYVTASLLISKLQSYPQKNALTKALQENGRINETIFVLKYLQQPEYQKKIALQLNKGEAVHSLRRDVFIANEGKIRTRTQEHQLNQASCLNLVVNAIMVWNTVYIQAVLNQLRNEGYDLNEEDIKHLSPARSEHINMYGKYYFNVEEGLKRKELRELRKPEKFKFR